MASRSALRVLPTKVHGFIDYAYALALIVTPWVGAFDDAKAPTVCLVASGALTVLYSLFTRYEWGMWKIIPMKAHLVLDLLLGAFLLGAPWAFRFSGRIRLPFVLFGLFAIVASLITETVPFGGNWKRLRRDLYRTPLR